MFDLKEIGELLATYHFTLSNELSRQIDQEQAEGQLKLIQARVLNAAYENSTISGKNAEARAREETAFLGECAPYLDALFEAREAQQIAGEAKIERLVCEAKIGLIKATLYSQGVRP